MITINRKSIGEIIKIYLAHPISGLSYNEVVDYFTTAKITYESFGYEVLHPMTAKGYLRTNKKLKAHGFKYPISTNHAIAERDRWMIKMSDIVLVDLFDSNNEVSIGCMMELAWASLLDKHTLVICPKDNIHYHAFVLEAADIVFEHPEDAVKYLKLLNKGKLE